MHTKKIVKRRANIAWEMGRDIWGICVLYLRIGGYYYLVLWTEDYYNHLVDLGHHTIKELLHG